MRVSALLLVAVGALAACSLNPGARDLDEAATTELCAMLDGLPAAASQTSEEAAETYRDLAKSVDLVVVDAPTSSFKEKARLNRLRAFSSQARLVSIHARVGEEVKRKEAEADLALIASQVDDC